MKRRSFIKHSLILMAGYSLSPVASVKAIASKATAATDKKNLRYAPFLAFSQPASHYRPFVRWWWNGDKVEAAELIRELRLMHEAGIGGVEINPISLPYQADDLGKKSLQWLSNEWMEMLRVTFDEAKRLGMTCDLIVGSGWPFGAENLKEDERASVMIINAVSIEGPVTYECTPYSLTAPVDPGVSDPNPLRKPRIISLQLVPNPMNSIEQVVDFSQQADNDLIRFDIPEGKHVLYALVQFESFASVINGAPGAAGSILDHMNKPAVERYLLRMSDTIEAKLGPLKNHIRALFTDSMELEGCNWTADFAQEFKHRNGYDLMPYLPFTMFKVGRLGAVVDDKYGVEKTAEFNEIIRRVRFDFEYTKAQLLYERFTKTYVEWCRKVGVKSRAQAYGRGFFPLEPSMEYDIPEGESWTTNWLRHKIGEEMSDDDYRRGRGYTMIDKYVSSAAHLKGKRLVSCEEMTNTYLVFNITLELLKIGSDQSAMSGITHSIWHGFNYSPPEAPFPGWVQYGSYYSERNNWWPWFNYLNNYKARLSSQLQHADMYTDMIILPANYDLWGEMGVQTDPFPERLNVPYTSILWESINKCGGAADYTTEIVLSESTVKNGRLCYGPKSYGVLFLPDVTSIHPETLEKLHSFVATGGRIFCIGKTPEKAPGLKEYQRRDAEVKEWVEKLKTFPDRFVLLPKPDENKFLEWYQQIQTRYELPHYLTIEKPNRFLMQTRYLRDDRSEFYFFNFAHRFDSHTTRITFAPSVTKGKQGWVWDLDNGQRARLELDRYNSVEIDFGPADSLLISFDHEKGGKPWKPLPTGGTKSIDLTNHWELELIHSLEKESIQHLQFNTLIDLKEVESTVSFCGTVIYRKTIQVDSIQQPFVLNLGLVHGVCELFVNHQSCGVKWYGQRIYDLNEKLIPGENTIEIRVVTSMGNYLKTLKDNPIVQKWVNRKGREQEIQPMGMIGPVSLYHPQVERK